MPSRWNLLEKRLLWVSSYYYLYHHEFRLPHFLALYARVSSFVHTEVAGCRGRRPVEEGAPNKFCAPLPGLRCGGGAAMRDRTQRTTFPIIPFPAAILAGGRWLPGVWPFRPPGWLCSPAIRASTVGGRGTLPGRASGDLGSSCPPSPLLHSWEPSPRVGPHGEAGSPPAGQGPEDPDRHRGLLRFLPGPPSHSVAVPTLLHSQTAPVFASMRTEH